MSTVDTFQVTTAGHQVRLMVAAGLVLSDYPDLPLATLNVQSMQMLYPDVTPRVTGVLEDMADVAAWAATTNGDVSTYDYKGSRYATVRFVKGGVEFEFAASEPLTKAVAA